MIRILKKIKEYFKTAFFSNSAEFGLKEFERLERKKYIQRKGY